MDGLIEAGSGVVGWNYDTGMKVPIHIPLLDNTASFLTGVTHIYRRFGREDVNLIAFALAVLCVPVFDTIRVMVLRIVRGKSPFMADKTHLHHMFIQVGTSHFITMLTEVLIMLVVMTVWTLSAYFGASKDLQFYLVVASAALLVWGTYALLSYHIQRDTKFLHKLAAFSVYTHLGGKKWWRRLAHGLDAPERRQPKFKDDE